MKFQSLIGTTALLLALTPALHAQKKERGILGQSAPAWEVTQWLNLPAKRETLDIADFKGKVIYLYNFQSWCPGCHSSGFPTLKKIIARYGDDPKVAIVAVQTTFEGFASNGFDDAKRVAERYDLKIPVGQSGTEEKRSAIMKNYRTGGTPWTIIIGPDGVVRYNDFHITTEKGGALIDQLKTVDKTSTP
jgi:thiol-disulfide isomerase/thioredoxin